MKERECLFNGKPIVSVIVPVYNCAETIADAIESVLAQTYSNWELICVDDGSTDNGGAIIEKYCRKDTRIRYIIRNRKPKGGAVCRNIGACEALGTYLVFLDGDDLLSKECLENRVKAIEAKDADFIVFPMASFKDTPFRAKKCSRTDVKNMKYYFASAQGGWQVTSPIFKIAFFKSLNGFNEAFPRLQDIELHLRAILQSGGNYIIRDDVLPDCYYRMSENHYTVKKIINGLLAHKLFFQLLKDHIMELDNVLDRSIAILCNSCSVLIELNFVETQGQRTLSYEEIIDPVVISYLIPRHKILNTFFLKTYHFKLGRILIKITRKLLLQKFIIQS